MSKTVQPLKFRRRSSPDRVLIVGGGLAGLYTALKLAPLPVTILTPRPLGQGASSSWAQGGIAAAIGEGDTPDAHAADSIAAGAGLVDVEVARLIAREAPQRIEDLLRYGVPFDRDLEGRLQLSREAAHSARRIVRVQGDQAGKAVMAALIAHVARSREITVIENVEAVELIRMDGTVTGVRAARVLSPGHVEDFHGRAVVLATGGIGQLFRVTTNPPEARGAGLAIAARAGAMIADAEFMQFHPTAFDIGVDPAPLASEALRGEGATLVNRYGQRFVADVHPAAELAPRDIVARAVHREIEAGRGAFLDCRMIGLKTRFPGAYAVAREAGFDPDLQPLPVAPAAHYHMGGVVTDVRGRTTLSGLWACGEVASTGAHGANRLASNSLLEALVFGARVADDIAADAHHWYALLRHDEDNTSATATPSRAADAEIEPALRAVMSRDAGVERTREGLLSALRFIAEARCKPLSHRMENMIVAAMFVTAGAFLRLESRGSHSRTDYPATDPRLARRSFLSLKQAEDALDRAFGGAFAGPGAATETARPRRAAS